MKLFFICPHCKREGDISNMAGDDITLTLKCSSCGKKSKRGNTLWSEITRQDGKKERHKL
jgi:hypothetical protein